MPYIIDRKNKCIYKKNPDGSRGKKVGCTKGSLQKYLKALYASENTMKLKEILKTIIRK
jgi:hypothetical protein